MKYTNSEYKRTLEESNKWLEVITIPQEQEDVGICKCRLCGSEIQKTRKQWRRKKVHSCPMCSDGISYPNKFLRAFIKQLPITEYIFEYSPKWARNKRYDAYFIFDNKEYVVEMDGIQHTKTTYWSSYKEQKDNDVEKEYFAKNNGVNVVEPTVYTSPNIQAEMESEVVIPDLPLEQ